MPSTNRDSSPFKNAMSRSKTLLNKITPSKRTDKDADKGKDKPDNNEDTAVRKANDNYKRRMRVVAESERREMPLNLGTDGWGTDSWEHKQQERRQQEEMNDLLSELDVRSGRGSSTKASPAPGSTRGRGSAPRAFSQSLEERGGPMTPERKRNASSGSPAHYNRPLPFRVPEQKDQPSSSPGNSPASSPYRAPSSSKYSHSTSSSLSSNANPLRTRTSGPQPPRENKRSGSYTSQGVRVGSMSSVDRERDAYLASAGFNVHEARRRESSGLRGSRGSDGLQDSRASGLQDARASPGPGTGESTGSRMGDGTKKCPGPTLF